MLLRAQYMPDPLTHGGFSKGGYCTLISVLEPPLDSLLCVLEEGSPVIRLYSVEDFQLTAAVDVSVRRSKHGGAWLLFIPL